MPFDLEGLGLNDLGDDRLVGPVRAIPAGIDADDLHGLLHAARRRARRLGLKATADAVGHAIELAVEAEARHR